MNTKAEGLREALAKVEVSGRRTVYVPAGCGGLTTNVTLTANVAGAKAIAAAICDELHITREHARAVANGAACDHAAKVLHALLDVAGR